MLTPKNGPTAVSYTLDFLANAATHSGRSSIVQVCHKTICLHGDDREVEGLSKNYKSVEEILAKLTASWLKLRNLFMFTSYRWILEEKKKNLPASNRNTDNTLPNPHHVPVKGVQQQCEFSLQGNPVLPWLGKLEWETPCLYSSLWSLNSEKKDGGGQFQTTVPLDTEFITKSSQTSTFLLVQTKHFILIQVLV